MKHIFTHNNKLMHLYSHLLFHATPFWLHLCYFIFVSFFGYLALKVLRPRLSEPSNLDLFFTSASATTVSSMSTVEMEVFSNGQLLIIAILMLVGGEVFTSMLDLILCQFKYHFSRNSEGGIVDSSANNRFSLCSPAINDQIELGRMNLPSFLDSEKTIKNKDMESNIVMNVVGAGSGQQDLKCNSIKILGYVVRWYLLAAHVIGMCLLSVYISFTPTVYNVLERKGLVLQTFSIFLTTSTFANCGFVPTNENMMVFRKNSGLLLILLPQILLGNTLFPACLQLILRILDKITTKREYAYILSNYADMGYDHLMSGWESCSLAVTSIGFLIIQFLVFSIMEWNSGLMEGMSTYEKLVGSLFQTTNSRHSGESIVDFSIISPPVLVLFVVMMYLPTYTSFLPISHYEERSKNESEEKKESKKSKHIIENLLLSQLSYLAIFVIIICITERKGLKEDPLNFTIFNIVVEVVSAYGNVGFSTGYSCKRQLKPDPSCREPWYGFVGRWSKGGKLALIVVMFFGRLKRFNLRGGKAWKTA